MSPLQPKQTLRLGPALFAIAALLALPYRAQAVTAIASITVSSSALTYTVVDFTQQYMTPNPPGAPITIGGQIVTKNTGSGSIVLLSPANISGGGGGVLKISYFSMTCSGTARAGQTLVATKTPLVASSSVTCATYTNNFDSSTLPGGQLNFAMTIFLDDRTLDNDAYPATNFTLVATAT
ncbi:MAG: hypothetical protein GIW97_05805 [Candidatus Eremiobacteraeota bacterium]|nr:hypothetical protein [Candidatus Eremiobacteraeota bacterium]